MRINIVCMLVSLALNAAAVGQSTAFTYQGELRSNGTLANGLHDIRFHLFDVANGGAQLVSAVCLDNVLVVNGRFTASIDFGQQFATTSPRFLEIDVRQDTGQDCSFLLGYTTLSPRQAITPAPRAAAASTANALATPSGASAAIIDPSGNIGIGTLAPTHSVHIANPAPTIALQDTDSSGATAAGQQVGYVSYRDSSNIERAWVGYGSAGDPDFSIVNARPSGDIVLNPFFGNVGIGTASPAAKLEVRGDIRMGSSGQLFATSGEENLRIIRGSVSSTGAIVFGSGFSVSHTTTGFYLITFTTPFATAPTCTGVNSNGANFVSVNTPGNTTGVVFSPHSLPSGTLVDAEFSFIIVGPR